MQWRKLLLMMKFVWIFILAGLLTANADTYSQTVKFDLKVQNVSLKHILSQIEEKTEFYFFYKNDEIEEIENLSVEAKQTSIEEVLDNVLTDKGFVFEVYDRYILIQKDGQNRTIDEYIHQPNSVSGTVSDNSGQPMPGVTVVVKGTTNGTITSFDGTYTISNIPEGATLQISFVGMKSQEIVVGNKAVINITLLEETIGIDEVVILGYSVESKKTMASATTALKNDELIGRSVSDTRQALQGKVAGVKVTNNGGDPGAGAKIVIRGIGSFSNTDPLYVIDGIQGGDINTIPPQNIESITILKDASTTAIYGSAAANGVVIVTTKGGKLGKVKVTYDGGVGIDVVTQRLDLLNASDYVDLVSDIQATNGLSFNR